MPRPLTVPASPLEPGADPHVVALQRAENFAPVLLASPDWNLRARSAVRKRIDGDYEAAKREWLKSRSGPEPRQPSERDVLSALGFELALDAYFVAQGFAAGEAELTRVVAAEASAP